MSASNQFGISEDCSIKINRLIIINNNYLID